MPRPLEEQGGAEQEEAVGGTDFNSHIYIFLLKKAVGSPTDFKHGRTTS